MEIRSSPNSSRADRRFRRLSVLTIATVYLLILAGGIVRSTGSGMGCPDWPRCFGRWVPPTQASQLPDGYAQIYGAKLKGEVVFNAAKTWIEYLNRLLGALTGVFIAGTVLAALPFLKKDPTVFWLSSLALVLVGLEGWLGSKVVSTELHPILVTAHLVLAILIVFVLLYAFARVYTGVVQVEKIVGKSSLNRLLFLVLLLTLVQVLLGTQVREAIDLVARRFGDERSRWVENLGPGFYIHRSFSLAVLAAHGYLVYRLRQQVREPGLLHRATLLLVWLVGAEVATGAAMGYLGVPAFLQPVHLVLAVGVLGLQFMVLLVVNAERVFDKNTTLPASIRV